MHSKVTLQQSNHRQLTSTASELNHKYLMQLALSPPSQDILSPRIPANIQRGWRGMSAKIVNPSMSRMRPVWA